MSTVRTDVNAIRRCISTSFSSKPSDEKLGMPALPSSQKVKNDSFEKTQASSLEQEHKKSARKLIYKLIAAGVGVAVLWIGSKLLYWFHQNRLV